MLDWNYLHTCVDAENFSREGGSAGLLSFSGGGVGVAPYAHFLIMFIRRNLNFSGGGGGWAPLTPFRSVHDISTYYSSWDLKLNCFIIRAKFHTEIIPCTSLLTPLSRKHFLFNETFIFDCIIISSYTDTHCSVDLLTFHEKSTF